RQQLIQGLGRRPTRSPHGVPQRRPTRSPRSPRTKPPREAPTKSLREVLPPNHPVTCPAEGCAVPSAGRTRLGPLRPRGPGLRGLSGVTSFTRIGSTVPHNFIRR